MSKPRQATNKSTKTRQLKRVIFVSQRQAENMRPPGAAALISITDTTRTQAEIKDGWHAVLRVSFDDVDPLTFPGQNRDLLTISSKQVAEIAAFAAEQSRSCKRIVVHCRHGVSRSAAVARAIAEAAQISFPSDYEECNSYVYLALRKAVRIAFNGV